MASMTAFGRLKYLCSKSGRGVVVYLAHQKGLGNNQFLLRLQKLYA